MSLTELCSDFTFPLPGTSWGKVTLLSSSSNSLSDTFPLKDGYVLERGRGRGKRGRRGSRGERGVGKGKDNMSIAVNTTELTEEQSLIYPCTC